MKGEQIMEQSNYLATEKVGTLMRKYAVPCIISLLVAALYNIVDQIFIANADYLGSYGNAANTVVFPLTVIALAIAVMIGDGCCAFVSLCLGRQNKDDAEKSIGNSVVLSVISGAALCAVYLIFQNAIVTAFGGTVNAETFDYSKEYFFYITLGIPFYMFGQAIRSATAPTAASHTSSMVNSFLTRAFSSAPMLKPTIGIQPAAMPTTTDITI